MNDQPNEEPEQATTTEENEQLVKMTSKYYSQRFEAVFLHLHPKGPKWSVKQTAKYIKKKTNFVQRWCERWKHEKNVNDQPNVKPERATTLSENEQIVKLFEQNPGMSLNEGIKELGKLNIHVSRSTVRRRLQAQNLVCKRATTYKSNNTKEAAITEAPSIPFYEF